MKKMKLFSKFFVLMLAISITAIGQYNGTNPNVAFFKTATASSFNTGFEPVNAVDSSIVTWCEIPGTAPAWLRVDLRAEHNIDGYGLVLSHVGELPIAFTLQGSEDGVIWTDLGNNTLATIGAYGYDVPETTPFRYVRLKITAKDAVASIDEFAVFGELLIPNPPLALAATGITAGEFTANWGELSAATGYRLDVSTSSNFNPYFSFYEDYNVGDVLSRSISGLSPGTAYYYRVRAYNDAGTSSSSNIITLTTPKSDQTITFGSLAAKTYGDPDFALSATASSALPVSFSSSDVNVATVTGTTVTIVGAGTTTITATQAGDAVYNAAIPVPQDLVVNGKELSVTGVTAANKEYDGTAAAVLSGGSLTGIIGADVVSLADATNGTFAQTDVGTGIAVSTSMTLTGADAGNYSIVQPSGITADITTKELTVSDVVADNKVYDGTTDATISGGVLNGIVGSDVVNLFVGTSGTFAQAGVGTGIVVSASMTLTGGDASNYTVAQPTGLTANIVQKELTVTADDMSREQCASNPVFTVSYSGFVGAEDAGVITSAPVGASSADETSPAGTYDITVSGGSADNYIFTYVTGTLTVTADVTNPVLVVQNINVQLDDTGNASITAADVVTSATDNCAVADTTLSQAAFTASDVGEVLIDVTLTDEAGNSVSEFVVVTVTGSTGLRELADFKASLYPNPTDGMVQLQSNVPVDELKVMDMTGKTVIKRAHLEIQETIDLSEYSNGVYIFQLLIEEELLHFRVVKN
jgi:hypothetical protein